MASVAIDNVTKFYGPFQALHTVSADIEDSEFIVLVGPSGCGKTTLLRMIAGLESIDSGAIAIDGRVVNRLPPRDRDVAMVFQNYALYPHKTVQQNMAFSLKLRKADKAVIEERVRRAAGILGLENHLDRYPRQLSGGQRQRVAMGRALVRDPKVFLFDEPLSNLDAKLRIQMRTEIKAIHQRVGTTAIYVTHDQVEAMTLASRIVVMNDGRVEQIGTPMELYVRPANLFVAGFIGSPPMNMLSGTVHRTDDGGPVFVLATGERLPVPGFGAGQNGQALTYGIRPEHLVINSAEPRPLEPVAATISVEPMGSETLVVADLAGTLVRILLREDRVVAPGDRLGLAPMLQHVHLFDAETGLAVRPGA